MLPRRNNTASLCLACSASLPPRKPTKAVGPDHDDPSETFLTPCCRRPICPACLRSNPRLARYNPCLHCLGGVGAVRAGKARASGDIHDRTPRVNVDGGVQDEDVFVLGDDDIDDVEDDEGSTDSDSPPPATPPSAYVASPGPDRPSSDNDLSSKEPSRDLHRVEQPDIDPVESNRPPGPYRYYIKPTDTLVGIALRFGVDDRLLCRLNGLPPSTLRTTPHLLHTRTLLTLPPTARGADLASSSSSSSAHPSSTHRAAQRARERAEKRFQTLTKEVDWRVAKAYVAVADLDDALSADGDADADHSKATSIEGVAEKTHDSLRKRHVSGGSVDMGAGIGTSAAGGLEARAVGRYMDDEEWEEGERRAGRGISIPAFPLLQAGLRSMKAGGEQARKAWGRWQQ